MLLDARGEAEFDLYLTNPKPEPVMEFLKSQKGRRDRKFRFHIRDENAPSISVQLGDESISL